MALANMKLAEDIYAEIGYQGPKVKKYLLPMVPSAK